MTRQLTLPQALFLLARDGQTGRPRGNYNKYIQPAGALADLVLRGNLELGSQRRPKVRVLHTRPTGSAYLDHCLEKIAASARPRRMEHWVQRLSYAKGRIHLIGEELVALGHVQKVPGKILGLFPVTYWPMPSPRAKTKLMADMAALMFNDTKPIDERTGSIIALANAGHLLKRNFDRTDLRRHKARIKDIAKGRWPAAASARAAIKAIQASTAAIAVVTMSAATG